MRSKTAINPIGEKSVCPDASHGICVDAAPRREMGLIQQIMDSRGKSNGLDNLPGNLFFFLRHFLLLEAEIGLVTSDLSFFTSHMIEGRKS